MTPTMTDSSVMRMNEIFSIENLSSCFNATATSKILFEKIYRMCIYK